MSGVPRGTIFMSQAVSYALYPAKTLKNTDFFLIFQSEHKEACHSNIILHKIRPMTIFFKVFINGLFISSAEKDREWHVPHVKAPNSNKTSMKYREFLRGCFISLLPSAYFPRRVQKKKAQRYRMRGAEEKKISKALPIPALYTVTAPTLPGEVVGSSSLPSLPEAHIQHIRGCGEIPSPALAWDRLDQEAQHKTEG